MSLRRVPLTLIGALSIASNAFAADTIFKKVEADGSVTFTDQPLEDAEITEGAPISVIGPTRSRASEGNVPALSETNAPAGSPAERPPVRATAASEPWRPPVPDALPGIASFPADADDDADAEPASGAATSVAPLPTDPGGTEPTAGAATAALVTDIRIAAPHDGAMLIDRGQPATLQLDATLTDTVFGDALRTDVLIDGEVVASGPLDRVGFPMPERGTHVLSARVTDAAGRVLATSASQTLHVKRARVR